MNITQAKCNCLEKINPFTIVAKTREYVIDVLEKQQKQPLALSVAFRHHVNHFLVRNVYCYIFCDFHCPIAQSMSRPIEQVPCTIWEGNWLERLWL